MIFNSIGFYCIDRGAKTVRLSYSRVAEFQPDEGW